MALGRRKRERQTELWVASGELPRYAGHPFYEKLNRLLAEAGFDDFVEWLCCPYYATPAQLYDSGDTHELAADDCNPSCKAP